MTLVTVTGTYEDAAGTAQAGTVTLTPHRAASHDTVVVPQRQVVAVLDENGEIELEVLASDSTDWNTDRPVQYWVTERIQGLPERRYLVELPTPGPVDLSAVQPLLPDTPYATTKPGPQGEQGPPGEDGELTEAAADARYVNLAGDTMTGALIVPAPTATTNVPRLARTPNAVTGDLGLPGFAGSDTGRRLISAEAWVVPNRGDGHTVDTIDFANIRRIGNLVEFQVRWLPATKPTSGDFVAAADSLPAGFRHNLPGNNWQTGGWMVLAPAGGNTLSVPASLNLQNSNIVIAYSAAVLLASGARWRWSDWTNQRIEVQWRWTTDDAWPTSLPGTQDTAPASWS
jgi:hypothetical protein